MDSRKTILDKVRKNKPTLETKIDLLPFLVDNDEDLTFRFGVELVENGGQLLIPQKNENLRELLLREINGNSYVDYSGLVDPNDGSILQDDQNSFSKINTAIFKVDLGVAENGSIWLEDRNLNGFRILPFIVEHGIFILPKTKIVPTMHHAYAHLNEIKTGFGTFIAGPSKTGDIEQHLVVGAHGPLSHMVILI